MLLILLKNLNLKNAEGLGVGGGCKNMLRGVRPDRGAPPETATVWNSFRICIQSTGIWKVANLIVLVSYSIHIYCIIHYFP